MRAWLFTPLTAGLASDAAARAIFGHLATYRLICPSDAGPTLVGIFRLEYNPLWCFCRPTVFQGILTMLRMVPFIPDLLAS